MIIRMTIFLHGLFMGLVATILIDIWALVLKSLFKVPITNWAMVGRWVGHLRNGQVVHESIGDAEPVTEERPLGWVTHYLIGLLYGIGYLWFMADIAGHTPGLISAMAFSVALLVAPWFILQPALGLGILARRAPKPWLMRGVNMSVHMVFGVGMYLGWWMSGQGLLFE